jgi:hypothetical protein
VFAFLTPISQVQGKRAAANRHREEPRKHSGRISEKTLLAEAMAVAAGSTGLPHANAAAMTP